MTIMNAALFCDKAPFGTFFVCFYFWQKKTVKSKYTYIHNIPDLHEFRIVCMPVLSQVSFYCLFCLFVQASSNMHIINIKCKQ